MADKYFDILDFFAEEETVNVIFETVSYNNSELDSNLACNSQCDIQEGSWIDIPIWIAIILSKINAVTI